MGISPRDLRRNMSSRRGQGENPTSIVETGIPPKSQKSSAIIMEKMDLQIALSKECGRRMDEYGETLKGMDRMLMEYDNQLMECQMQLSKYDNQLMESQKMLSECSGRLIDEVPKAVLTKGIIEQYESAICEYKNAVDKYYGIAEQYQEQIDKIVGTEEDRMAGVQMALDLTYIKEELDELKQYIEKTVEEQKARAVREDEAVEEMAEDDESAENAVERFFDGLEEANITHFQEQARIIVEKADSIIKQVQDTVYTHNMFIDEKFKNQADMLEVLDNRREEGIIRQNKTLIDRLQAQNNILDDKLQALGDAFAQIFEEKLLVQSKTMVDKLQVQNHLLEEEVEALGRLFGEMLQQQSEQLQGKISVQGRETEEKLLAKNEELIQKLESLLKKPEGEEGEEDEVLKLLKENNESLKTYKEDLLKKIVALDGALKEQKGQVTTAKSELSILIDRTMGPVERRVGKMSVFMVISLILNLVSLAGIAAVIMQLYGL